MICCSRLYACILCPHLLRIQPLSYRKTFNFCSNVVRFHLCSFHTDFSFIHTHIAIERTRTCMCTNTQSEYMWSGTCPSLHRRCCDINALASASVWVHVQTWHIGVVERPVFRNSFSFSFLFSYNRKWFVYSSVWINIHHHCELVIYSFIKIKQRNL